MNDGDLELKLEGRYKPPQPVEEKETTPEEPDADTADEPEDQPEDEPEEYGEDHPYFQDVKPSAADKSVRRNAMVEYFCHLEDADDEQKTRTIREIGREVFGTEIHGTNSADYHAIYDVLKGPDFKKYHDRFQGRVEGEAEYGKHPKLAKTD